MDFEDGRAEVSMVQKDMVQRDIILFGTGKYFENYMMSYGLDKPPLFAVDNDAEKAGTEKMGVPIWEPSHLLSLDKDSFYVIICSAQWSPIAAQLEEMGICDYQYYRQVPMDRALALTLSDEGQMVESVVVEADASVEDTAAAEGAISGKPYKIGYVPGVFDLFHVGHLNLLRNSKSRCEYLIAGVLTDELVEHFKGKRPLIPYEQRAAIVSAITYVDRVVPVDFTNTRKIDAWYKYHYDCHFSGNDHGVDWMVDVRQLREVGSNMEFFEYTKATSSTKIKERM